MKNFILGIIFTLIVFAVGAYVTGKFGLVNLRADQTPSDFEKKFAMGAMDASTERHAPQMKNPIEPNEANLRDGMHVYMMRCAECHGDGKNPESPMGLGAYPPAPQFVKEPADMPEHENYYIIQHGVRWTAMPSWQKVLSDQDIWKVATFIGHMDKLPPALQQDWSGGAPPPAASEEKHEHHH